jgi:hypothetical protein
VGLPVVEKVPLTGILMVVISPEVRQYRQSQVVRVVLQIMVRVVFL